MLSVITTIIIALLRAIVPALVAGAVPTAEDGDPDTKTRDALRERIRATWGETTQ